MDEFEARFRRSFGVVAFTCNRYIVDHMRRLNNSRIGLELETALIWGIIAHLSIARSIRPGFPSDDVINEKGMFVGELHPVRVADIVQISGVPKETVRRKLEKLRTLGKVERTGLGRWVVSRNAVDQETFDLTREAVKSLLATARQIESLLAHVKLPPHDESGS
ncbi:hypothetical protein [Thauera butanivorans]|jgi:DNA-binding transcriptional ArsR family regulator|uniref:hypothetical protein n=1 Tax=Thauera butanivorans TaxID=86174 RepID=UPI0008381D5B|nr:hypothetical protein [Thauera butanivorans]